MRVRQRALTTGTVQDLALKRVLLRVPCEPPPRPRKKLMMTTATKVTQRIAPARWGARARWRHLLHGNFRAVRCLIHRCGVRRCAPREVRRELLRVARGAARSPISADRVR